jgi:outer membrane murein-binding lipoprotein Lpp
MRAVILATGTVLLLAGTVASGQQNAQPTNAELMKEVRELRKAVEVLTEKVEELDKKLGAGKAQAAAQEWPGGDNFVRKGPDLEALGAIKLPPNPTKEQVRDYVNRILVASKLQNVFSSDDPQSAMLMQVGPENLDVLLEASPVEPFGDTYTTTAIAALAREEDKKRILDALPYNHGLANVVLAKGWEQDARDILVAELESGARYLPIEWIEAVVRLRDPKTYDALKGFLISGSNRSSTYGAIKRLPDIDLTDAVAQAWRNSQLQDRWETASMACIALEFGHKDALEHIINSLDVPDGSADAVYGGRGAVLRYTEARGTTEQIRRWYEANRDNLVWDSTAKKFRVQEPKPQ